MNTANTENPAFPAGQAPFAGLGGNPEFQRNLWLELSAQRLILMPALIAFILFVIISFQGLRVTANVERIAQSVAEFCLTGILGLSLWGMKLAADTLTQEAREGTWDNQRMSCLTPWQMIWGKLLGGTIYTWYGNVILLVIGTLAAAMAGIPLRQIALLVVGPVALGVLLQSASMLSVLLAWHRKGGATREATRFGFVSFLFYLFLFQALSVGFFAVRGARGGEVTLQWWGGTWPVMDFFVLSLVCLALWSVLGLWLAMRRELLEKNSNGPWWWLVFLVFWSVWGLGLGGHSSDTWSICAMFVWTSAYLQLFLAPKDRMAWRKLRAALESRDSRRIRHLWPLWTISVALALLLSVVAIGFALPRNSALDVALFLASVSCFAIRDFAWVFWLFLAPNNRRAEGAMIVSFAVAYLVLPFTVPGVFLPYWSTYSDNPVIPYFFLHALQAAVALILLYLRWRQVSAEPSSS
ncbi:MAG: hypothetical protein LBO00_09405 [Zoogloeaceae bacterium]|jgi:hypothetical protein|nr:hypothetical protein [Zoogloeaceae bacterium]